MDINQRLKSLADSDQRMQQQLENYEHFSSELDQIKQQYLLSKSPEALVSGIRLLSEKPVYHPFAHFLIFLGDSYMESGDFAAGVACMKTVVECFPYINHYAVFYLRMAQYHIEKGDPETGIDFLIRLCTEVTDYEMQVTLNNLTEVWKKYKPLVADKRPDLVDDEIPEPITFAKTPQPLTPDNCSQSIAQILSLPQSDLLSGLSTHLGEMTASGTVLNY